MVLESATLRHRKRLEIAWADQEVQEQQKKERL